MEAPLVTSDIGLDSLVASHGYGTATAAEDVQAAINEAEAEQEDFQDGSETPSEALWRPAIDTAKLTSIIVSLPKSTLINPRSIYEPFEPRAPEETERLVVQRLLTADSLRKNEYVQFELDDFSCFVIMDRHPFEMRALHDHATRTGKEKFLFNGTLRSGETRYSVRNVEFDQIPLGNYGKDPCTGKHEPSVGDQLWIRSKLNAKKEIYYQLKKPAPEYARFHEPFLWVADLAKHMFDFCESLLESDRPVSIHVFKEDFGTWLRRTHADSVVFYKWYSQRQSDDFRQSIVANEPFLRKEMYGTFGPGKFRHLHVFRQIASPFDFYKRIGYQPKGKAIPYTIVTPYIYDCFSHLDLGGLLKPIQPTISAADAIWLSWPENGPKTLAFIRQPSNNGIHVGDLISTPPDDVGSGTKWQTDSLEKKWYGLVQKIHITKKGERRFDVTWLYQPDDTPCCSMKYPWTNELFLSENCTCHQSLPSKVAEGQVLNIHSVEWFGSPNTSAEFFVRQTYNTVQRRFVTLKDADLKCNHRIKISSEYSVGDTVLALSSGAKFLEPCELLEFINGDRDVRLRVFRRRRDFVQDCAPNNLVYTEQEICLPVRRIASRCIIRYYSPDDSIPAPYNRGGVGNAFFITHRLLNDGTLRTIGSDRPQLRQGFDPRKTERKLPALDLFCGCGNFGRGLEDGGGVEVKWANDIWEPAIHTYMANTKDPEAVKPFLGSIDDLLQHAMEGKFSDTVPRPGQVSIISGGSPCKGFSLLTGNKMTIEQKKNRSLVAAFAAFLDFERPRLAVLENVRTIVQSKKNRNQDFFSQLICAVVGMGYQCQIILGDAWSHGSPQTRVRAFLCVAAPGVDLPNPPYPSHSNPADLRSGGLGRMTNGEPYVVRSDRPTAFEYVTSSGATADLPNIYDGKPDTCIPCPDHRLSISLSSADQAARAKFGQGKNARTQLLNIPNWPYGMNFAKAYYDKKTPEGEPDMFEHERDAYPPLPSDRTKPNSKGWGHAHPHKLFPTVTTNCHWTDARIGGAATHWDQPRPFSIMEVRRAQSVPDEEVLLGTPADQWEMVGNAVARGISTALGLALREAAWGTLYEDGVETPKPGVDLDAVTQQQTLWTDESDETVQVIDDGEEDDAAALPSWPSTREWSGVALPSRNSSRTPGLDTASTSVTGCCASTPVASQSDTPRDFAPNGKRPLPRVLAVEQLTLKKPRVEEYESDGTEIVRTVAEPTGYQQQDEPRSATGAKIVRLSSADLEDGY